MTYRDERVAWSILDAMDHGADYEDVEKVSWAGYGHRKQDAKGEALHNMVRRPKNRIYEVSDAAGTKRLKRASWAGAAAGGIGAGVPTLGAGAIPGAAIGSIGATQYQWNKERKAGNLKRMTGAEIKAQKKTERQARRDQRRRDREGKFA